MDQNQGVMNINSTPNLKEMPSTFISGIFLTFLSPPLQSDFDDVITCFCYDPDFNLVQFVEGRQIRKKS